MTKKCPNQSCNKEFEIPVLINNFTFTPKKETYHACPYCLTKIKEKIESTEHEKPTTEKKEEMKTEYKKKQNEPLMTTENSTYDFETPASIEEIQNLEKEKMDLLEELDLLKQDAEKRIDSLKEELLDLKIEREKLRKIIKE